MARLPRLTLPDFPHHVIQRGNNRQPIVLDDVDRRRLLLLLGEQARQFQVALHAWVLMDNHFHLLLTPSTADGLPKMMQAVGRSHVRWFNDRHARSGALWEGRYKSTVIETERYLLACMAYIDLNPVRAGMVEQPLEHAWSSHGYYVGRSTTGSLAPAPHPLYWALGNTPFARECAYADMVQAGIGAQQQAALTDSALRGWALGEPPFVGELQKRTPRRVSQGKKGRPYTAGGEQE